MIERDLPIKRGEENAAITVERIVLERFRNYHRLELNLSEGFNVVAGQNAQGKTNLLESLYLIATTRLLRGQRDTEAIQEGEQGSKVSIWLREGETKLSLSLERGARKRAFINDVSLPRAADLLGRLPCVSISSSDMVIVRGDPTDRRSFLDLELSALYPAYLNHLAHYKRAVEHRNALLREAKEGFVPDEVFEPWELHVANHGAPIRQMRQNYLHRLSQTAHQMHSRLGQGETLQMAYDMRDDANTPEALSERLTTQRRADIARGGTSIGPHRDDISILVDGREARLYGSQGQQRTAVIACKMGSMSIISEVNHVPPLLLLDDILSDLDEKRRALLVEVVLDTAHQAVLTCTEASAAGEKILDQAKVFQVRSGSICEA